MMVINNEVNRSIKVPRGLRKIIILIALVASVGCQTTQEKVTSEREEAKTEIGKAQNEVQKVEQEASKEIAAETSNEEKNEEKIEATKEIAKAERVVENEKIEATEEILDAEQNAGSPGSLTHVNK